MPNTHCLPSGSLGTSEVPCPHIGSTKMQTVTPGGSKRGVVVMMHGLNTAVTTIPGTLADSGGFVPTKELTLATALAADGWVVLYPTYGEDWAVGNPAKAVFDDINADAGHGARYLAMTLHWWDHIVTYIKATYGTWPIVPFGISWGGWHAFQVAANRSSTIIAYANHASAVILSQAGLAWSTPVDFSTVNTTGLDVGAHAMDTVSLPGLIGWQDSDTAAPPANIQAVANNAIAAGKSITTMHFAGDHSYPAAAATATMSWFTGTVDALAPAVH